MTVDPSFWRDRSVLVTGHTGFKGAWLSLWLQSLGAGVTGLALPYPPTTPSLYELARVGEGMESMVCDIRDPNAVAIAVGETRPEVVFHMAAQPLVRRSFSSPAETYETNVMGTVHLLDAVRACESVKAVVVVTSDKCYAPSSTRTPHREGDPLGGNDPYSSSKAATELVCQAYRHSFFTHPHGPRLATARAGNVIGGGDFGEDRLLPDLFRAASTGETLRLRNPSAVRPWQHVLSPLSGYLMLAQALFSSPEYARGWNFGPSEHDLRTVEWVVTRVSELLPNGVPWEPDASENPPESAFLALDSTLARERLGWAPVMTLEGTLAVTVGWYGLLAEGGDLRGAVLSRIEGLAEPLLPHG
jgi:CDP-glucose 4,6-dehydratase